MTFELSNSDTYKEIEAEPDLNFISESKEGFSVNEKVVLVSLCVLLFL
jgi:hypothetical protein